MGINDSGQISGYHNNNSGQHGFVGDAGSAVPIPLAGEIPPPAVLPTIAVHGFFKSDFLWQNDNGEAGIWLMNGTNVIAQANIGQNPGPSWHVAGVGDFNNDGKADIVWQNDNGQAGVWLMDGTNVLSEANVGGNPGTDWHVLA